MLTPGVNIILGEAPNQSAPIVTALWRHKRRSRLVPPLGGHNPPSFSCRHDIADLRAAIRVAAINDGEESGGLNTILTPGVNIVCPPDSFENTFRWHISATGDVFSTLGSPAAVPKSRPQRSCDNFVVAGFRCRRQRTQRVLHAV